jgi:hypothetical protein
MQKRTVFVQLSALLLVALWLPGCSTLGGLVGGSGPKEDRITISSTCYWLPGATVPNRVAVLDFEGQRFQGGGSRGGQALTDVMIMNLLENGFTVMERDHLQDVLAELEMGEKGYQQLSDVEKAQKLGKVLNAEAIITGKLLRQDPPRAMKAKGGKDKLAFGNGNVELAARAINVQTGEIIWMTTINTVAESKTGQMVRYSDYLDEACAELVYSLKHPDYKEKKNMMYKKQQITELRESRKK